MVQKKKMVRTGTWGRGRHQSRQGAGFRVLMCGDGGAGVRGGGRGISSRRKGVGPGVPRLSLATWAWRSQTRGTG